MKRCKKGQFYILAALILIAVVFSFVIIKNYAKPEAKKTKVYDLGKELKIETGNVYDYGVYNNNETKALIEDWIEKYKSYSEGKENVEDWIFIYGDYEDMTGLVFIKTVGGRFGIVTGEQEFSVEIKEYYKNKTAIRGHQGEINVTFGGINYNFALENGKNFYFVIKSGNATTEG